MARPIVEIVARPCHSRLGHCRACPGNPGPLAPVFVAPGSTGKPRDDSGEKVLGGREIGAERNRFPLVQGLAKFG